jgi:MoaA/NifB/PqqE/SkfB family radical SAM enzyme
MDLFQKIVDEMGRYLFRVDLFNWGEPLFNTHLADMVSILKGCGVDEVRVSSNLSMAISDATILSLIKSGLDVLTVSIDGMSQATYTKYRVGGNLALALLNMERFAKAKKELRKSNPYIDWQFLVFSFNENELSEARKYARKIGVDLRPSAPYVDLVNFPEWLSSLDEYVMDRYKKTKGAEKTGVQEIVTQSVEERMEFLSSQHYKGCDWHYLLTAINANGSVSPCCGIMREADDFGSLDGKTFAEVWNNEMFRAARKYLKYQSSEGGSGNVCMNCDTPEIMVYAQCIVRSALQNAPEKVKARIKRLIPTNPLVKELSIEEATNAFRATSPSEVLRQKDEHVADLEEEPAGPQGLLRAREIEHQLALKEEALQKIYNSNGWKALTTYYRIRDKVLAPNPISGILNRRFLNLIRRSRRGDVKDLLKQMIVGTSLEPLARKLHAAFTREPCASCISNVEDKNRLYDKTIEHSEGLLCLYPFYSMEFTTDGSVYTCCPAWIKTSIGNIKDKSIDDIWNSDEAMVIREKMYAGKWQKICNPVCPILSKYRHDKKPIDYKNLNCFDYLTPPLINEIGLQKVCLESSPTSFTLSNSTVCNLSCIMCVKDSLVDDPGLMKKTADDIMKHLATARRIVMSGMGDPFARQDTRGLLTNFRGNNPNLKIDLVTNGLLMPKYWEQVKHQKFGILLVSVDGATKGTYEKIRRGGKWEQLLRSFSLIEENRDSFSSVTINMTVMRENYHEILDFIHLAESYRFNASFQRVRGMCDDQNIFELGDFQAIAELHSILAEEMGKKRNIYVSWGDLLEFATSRP